MGVVNTYLSAVAAGALTAGLAAANIVAVPPDTAVSPQPTARDIDLSASVTIPIINFDETVGPLRLIRKLFIEAGTDPLLLGIIQQGGNSYNLPGLNTVVNSTSNPRVTAVRGPDSVDFGFDSVRTESGGWDLLGAVQSSAEVNGSRSVHLRPFFGGSEGIGAQLYGVLDQTAPAEPISRSLRVLGSGFDTESNRTTGAFDGELALLPFDGFKAVGGGTLIEGDNTTTANLGSLQLGAGSRGGITGNGGLCLGSAQGTSGGCASGDTSFVSLAAPIQLGLGTGGSSTNLFSVDFPQNNLAVALGNGRFAVTGQLGGTVSVGGLEFGRPIDIDFQIPRASSMLSSTSSRQQQSVRTSFLAVPRSLGSDNGTASAGRHAARDAVNSAISEVKTAVKTAVSNVTQSKPRHAKPDTDD
jgi:hypothetical protein